VPEEMQGFLGVWAMGVGLEDRAPRCGTLVEHLVGNELGVDLQELPPPVLVSQDEGDKVVEVGAGTWTERNGELRRLNNPWEGENHVMDVDVAVHLNLRQP
jgi:hypothetical protein